VMVGNKHAADDPPLSLAQMQDNRLGMTPTIGVGLPTCARPSGIRRLRVGLTGVVVCGYVWDLVLGLCGAHGEGLGTW
jgi:hypothetical protein